MIRHSGEMVRDLLVCPVCKGQLSFSAPKLVTCQTCRRQYPQNQEAYYDLVPDFYLNQAGPQWQTRQQEMNEWYQNLITDFNEANRCFQHDYAPYGHILSALSGRVLDIGGGNGIVRHFLPDHVAYITVEPSPNWLQTEWGDLAERFPCLNTPLHFVRGVGEYLPFPAETFDAVLSFWSLNHVSQPALVFKEVYQALKPEGRFLLVLEDMQPKWTDLHRPVFRYSGWSQLKNVILAKLWYALGRYPWPVQVDHIYISESDLNSWSTPFFTLGYRVWVNQYLTFEFKK